MIGWHHMQHHSNINYHWPRLRSAPFLHQPQHHCRRTSIIFINQSEMTLPHPPLDCHRCIWSITTKSLLDFNAMLHKSHPPWLVCMVCIEEKVGNYVSMLYSSSGAAEHTWDGLPRFHILIPTHVSSVSEEIFFIFR